MATTMATSGYQTDASSTSRERERKPSVLEAGSRQRLDSVDLREDQELAAKFGYKPVYTHQFF